MSLPPEAIPATTPRFLCDAMLQRLGHWLRTAGYDVVMAAEGEADYARLRRAIDDGRILLTRDPALAKMRRAEKSVVVLQSDNLEGCAQELTERLAINWQLDPFGRCLQCNSLLASASQVTQAVVPEEIDRPLYYCPGCQQVFWDDSNVSRMRTHLSRWQDGDYCQSSD